MPREDLSGLVENLLAAWRMNGQIYGREFATAWSPNEALATLMTPEADALSPDHDNKYCRKFRADLEARGVKLECCLPGESLDGAEPCTCNNRQSFVLFTSYVALESSLRCGECFGPVPLYKIPATYDDEYHDLVCWQSDYSNCDQLQMNCHTLERAATREISSLHSSLTKDGLDICSKIKEGTGLPVYYYLYKYNGRSLRAERNRKCPCCGGEWLLGSPWHDRFDFRCDKCHLLSNIAWDVR